MAVLLVAKALCMPVAVDHCVADKFSFLPEPCGGSNSKERLQTTTKPNRKAKSKYESTTSYVERHVHAMVFNKIGSLADYLN